MKSLLATTCIVALIFSTGCAKNPADDVDAAKTTAPTPTVTAPAAPATGAATFTVSPESTIAWKASKVTNSHDGGFKVFTGTFGATDGALSAIDVTIDMDSTFSDSTKLTGHLKNADFFDVPKFPTSTFVMTSSKPATGPNQTTIVGNFTLHGVTKQIEFPAQVTVSDQLIALKAEFSINRSDFGIVYKGKADDLIRDEVVIKLDVKATK